MNGGVGDEDDERSQPRMLRRAGSLFEWPAVSRAALVVALPAPVFVFVYFRLGLLLSRPTEEPYLARDVVVVLRHGMLAYLAGAALAVLGARWLRRRAPDHRGFVTATLLAFFVAIAIASHLVGAFTTPVIGLFIAASAVCVLLFDWKTAVFTSGAGGLGIVVSTVLVYYGLAPYGPLFREPVFFHNDPPRTYLLTVALLSLALVAVALTFIQLMLERWRKHDERLHHLARFDGLTEVANRRHFLELLGHEVLRAQRFGSSVGFVILDLDHFKAVNDAHGHQAGDSVLAHVARVLSTEVLRRIDVVGRYGGEEFAMFLPETDLAGTMIVAERARRAISTSPVALASGERLHVTASLGCAVFPHAEVEGIDGLVRRADDALYRSKAEGRDRTSSLEP